MYLLLRCTIGSNYTPITSHRQVHYRIHINCGIYIGTQFSEHTNIPAANFLSKKSLERYRGISERDFDILKCLNVLQSIYNGAKSNRLRTLDDKMMKEFTVIINAFIDALRNYFSRITLRTPTKYNAALECKLLSEDMAKTSSTPIDEKLIYERQMLAVIALLCTDFPNTTHSLLFAKCDVPEEKANQDDEMNGESRIGSFVDILADVLCNIGQSVSK